MTHAAPNAPFVDGLRRAARLAGSLVAACALASVTASAAADHVTVGTLPPGPLDAIVDVAGVRVASVTKIAGNGALEPGHGPVRTGVTVVVPNADIWNDRVAAATEVLNGNGEMTGTHWVDEAGFLEVPIALTNTLDVGRVDDGVIDWLIAHHPDIGVSDDVPLPVVAECDDQGLNDIQGRHVLAADTVQALDAAGSLAFPRGNVGAGTGMRAFGFKGGIGTASRVIAHDRGGYTVGVLVNANTGSREELRIDGVPVGRELRDAYPPSIARPVAAQLAHGRAADGSVIVVVATDAPLESRQLHEIAKRAMLGLARTGATSHVSSGDLFIAFSTTRRYPRDPHVAASSVVLDDEDQLDALFAATAEATEAAIVDALLSARTMTGARNYTLQALPIERVRTILRAHGVTP